MPRLPRLVVFSGAGISAESGLRTFRDSGGLWEEFELEDVATPEGFARNPELVLRFYDARRRQVRAAEPNAAHRALAEAEARADIDVITQNIDDLHERAGSTRVLHLHGEILKARSSVDPLHVVDLGDRDLPFGTLCPRGAAMRPDVVWFGEEVPAMEPAMQIAAEAEVLLVVGTGLTVYPAASLVHVVPHDARIFVVDPDAPAIDHPRVVSFREAATTGVPRALAEALD